MSKQSKKSRSKRNSTPAGPRPVYDRIREILESARLNIARSVNTTQVVANWLIGREIVEEEQQGKDRAQYGQELMRELSQQLTVDFGRGYSVDSLFWFRRFYLGYPSLIEKKFDALRQISQSLGIASEGGKTSKKSADSRQMSTTPSFGEIAYAPRKELSGDSGSADSWQPGTLSPNLSWTHYRTLLRVDSPDIRAFYEIESIKNNWGARELERQINSLLYQRLAKSKDKKGLMKLATQGQEIARPADVFKDPVVIEFLGLPESPKLIESDLETALLNDLQAFLLELGTGFAFVARQQRITLDGDHFYIDLVFYHTVLKCFVLIDLKVGKLTHGDLGQLQLYVNYYDHERCTAGDNPTLGLILCTDKNDAVVKYTLGPEQSQKIFASRYQLHLPSEQELRDEILREVQQLPEITSGKRSGKRKAKKA